MDESFFSQRSILHQICRILFGKHEEKIGVFLVNLYSFSGEKQETKHANPSHANELRAK